MTTTQSHQDRINACKSLYQLCKELNEITTELRDADDEPRCLGDVINLTNLPTFGGAEPASTLGIWSWDDDEMLIEGNGGRDHYGVFCAFEIVDRD